MTSPEESLDSARLRGSVFIPRPRLGYRPALDGIRGICILIVLAAHAKLLPNAASFIGVNTFFVLSGFLITTLLVEEWQQFGGIELKLFYARRALRLFPALVLLIIVMISLEWLITAWRPYAIGMMYDGFWTLLYASNWVRICGYYEASVFTHTWTLSIEEQFYLIWPPILSLALKFAASFASIVRWLILAIVLVLFWRMLLFRRYEDVWRIYRGTDTRADSLLIGCLIGILFASRTIAECPWAKKCIKLLAFLAIPLLILFGCRAGNPDVNVYVVYPLVSLLTAVIIVELLLSENGALEWCFTRPLLVYVGKLSYGLYVWHYPIIRIIEGKGLPRTKELALEISLIASVTALSFYLVEQPILRYKKTSFSRV